jgi:hypothetical protein
MTPKIIRTVPIQNSKDSNVPNRGPSRKYNIYAITTRIIPTLRLVFIVLSAAYNELLP